jgi:tmRNA-binding protein
VIELLLRRAESISDGQGGGEGLTVVPLRLYINIRDGKIELGLARANGCTTARDLAGRSSVASRAR